MKEFQNLIATIMLGMLFIAVNASGTVEVSSEEVTSPHGIEGCLRITTTVGTYYFQPKGGGLASLIDRDGKDWIGHSSTPKDAGQWRGIPQANLIDFRPERSKGTSVILSQSETQVEIESKTEKGTALWTFYDSHVDWKVTEASNVFTLSYEGAPYGDFSKSEVTYTLSDGRHDAISEGFNGDIEGKAGQGEWVYFSHSASERGLLFVHHTDDDVSDYMGSLTHMTVFGFGRNGGGQNYVFETTPQTFSIGLIENASVETAGTTAADWRASSE